MAHNYELTSIRQKKRCYECGKKARTIAQPNDSQTYSRVSDYRIICVRCKKTFLVIEGDYKQFEEA